MSEHFEGDARTSAADESAVKEKRRIKSSVLFPAQPLERVAEVADAIHKNVGTGICSDHQLAPWLNMSSGSSTFRIRVAAAKVFGIVESVSAGKFRLTDLGGNLVDPVQADKAKVDAFLHVALYKSLFDRHSGRVLPAQAGLEQELIALGVAPNRASPARSTFEKSAQYAGFFAQGRDRLVKPGFAEPEVVDKPVEREDAAEDQDDDSASNHPFIQGLLRSLPKPETAWTFTSRATWLRTAASCFDLMYKGTGNISISISKAESDQNIDEKSGLQIGVMEPLNQ